MQVQPSVGLQWKIGLFQLATSFVACIATGLSFLLARQAGAPEAAALTTGLGLGVLVALAGSGAGFWWARTIKFRLWEAGDLATRIAQGDLKHRLVPGPPDELGWLEHQLNAMAGHLERAVAELRDLADQNRRLAEQAGRGAALVRPPLSLPSGSGRRAGGSASPGAEPLSNFGYVLFMIQSL